MSNMHADGIGTGRNNSRILDPIFKEVVRNPDVLSNLLKDWIDELKDMEPEQIRQCLDIGDNGRVQSLDTHLFVGKTSFVLDNYFRIRAPGQEEISCFIDMEGQISNSPGYDIHDRMICYMARMIDEQMSGYERQEYSRLRKCYVIFIMLRPRTNDTNRIKRYAIMRRSPDDPKIGSDDGEFDKVEILEVTVPGYGDVVQEGAMEILKLLFSRLKESEAISDRLTKVYNIYIDKPLSDRMSDLDEQYFEYLEYMGKMKAKAEDAYALMIEEGRTLEEALSIIKVDERSMPDFLEAFEAVKKEMESDSEADGHTVRSAI